MKSKIQITTLAVLTTVIYVAFCAAKIAVLAAHPSWLYPVDLWHLASRTITNLAAGAFFLVFLAAPPYLFLLLPSVISAIACAIHYRPKPLRFRLLVLIAPWLTSLPLAAWGAYVSLTRKHILGNYSEHIDWASEILKTFWQASFIPITLVAAYFLINKDHKEERLFALSVLILVGCLIFLQFMAASMPTTNSWF